MKIWKGMCNKDEKFNKVSFQSINGLNISEKHILVCTWCTDAGHSNTFTTNTTGKSCDFLKADDFANQKSQTSGRSKKIKRCLAFIQTCKLKICMQQNNSVQYASTYTFFFFHFFFIITFFFSNAKSNFPSKYYLNFFFFILHCFKKQESGLVHEALL